MSSPFLVFSFLTLFFLSAGKPLYASACATMALLSVIQLNHTARQKKPKRSKTQTFDNWSEFTLLELTKPIEYLRETYPDKSDTEILNIREKEMQKLLDEAVKVQFKGKSKTSEHFTLKTFYSINGKKELVYEIIPHSKFGSDFIKGVGNEMLKRGRIMYEEEEE